MTGTVGFDRLFVFGAGGHGREVAWLAHEVHPQMRVEFVVDAAPFAGQPVNGIPVRLLDRLEATPRDRYVVAVGDSELRRRAAAKLASTGMTPASLTHPRATIAPTAKVGAGSVICAGAIVSDHVVVGDHVIVNVATTVSHDVVIGDFATLSPGVHIAGNVEIGSDAFLGIGAVVGNGSTGEPLVIGSGAVIAAGAVVVRSVTPRTIVGGVPARRLRSAGE